jgi:hypothetical protein
VSPVILVRYGRMGVWGLSYIRPSSALSEIGADPLQGDLIIVDSVEMKVDIEGRSHVPASFRLFVIFCPRMHYSTLSANSHCR